MSAAPIAAGPRVDWSAVPARVRAAVDAALGSPVQTVAPQHGGFSPGAAVRLVCADGRRAFVKAVGAELNPQTPDMYRAEAAALALVPRHLPAARLLSTYDDGQWVALVLEDIEGRRPDVPWTDADATAMSATLRKVAATRAPEALSSFADRVDALTAWDLVREDPSGIDAALVDRLPELLELQSLARDVTRGDALVHWDARADNVLIDGAGHALLLDWAWACRGAPWLDTLLLAADFRIQGGPDADEFLRHEVLTHDVPPAHLHSMIACMVGVWHERARLPAPPGLPTIRVWQAHCGRHALQWLDEGALWS